MKPGTLLLAVTLMFAAPQVAAFSSRFEAGQEAYRLGDFTGAKNIFVGMAENADGDAYGELGAMYLFGDGFPQDSAEALELLQIAVEFGSRRASDLLLAISAEELGMPKNRMEAVDRIQRAARQGLREAQYYVAVMYDIGRGVPQDHSEAMVWYRKAANKTHVEAEFALAMMYDRGVGVPRDYEKAYYWFDRASGQGHPDAVLQLNEREVYLRLQFPDMPHHQASLGEMYLFGHGVPQDSANAVEWLQKAAKQRSMDAASLLSVISVESPDDIPGSLEEVVERIRGAAYGGSAAAQYWLGRMTAAGWGVPFDRRESAAWFRRSAGQGFARAQYYLGLSYELGFEGTPRDHAEMIKWYRKAVEQGDADAMQGLAEAYYHGEGVGRNVAKAMELSRKALESGQPDANWFLLGILAESSGLD